MGIFFSSNDGIYRTRQCFPVFKFVGKSKLNRVDTGRQEKVMFCFHCLFSSFLLPSPSSFFPSWLLACILALVQKVFCCWPFSCAQFCKNCLDGIFSYSSDIFFLFGFHSWFFDFLLRKVLVLFFFGLAISFGINFVRNIPWPNLF